MMSVSRVELLRDGHFELDMGFLVYLGRTMGKKYAAKLQPMYIETDSSRIIIDLGIGELPEEYIQFFKVKRPENITLEAVLRQKNIDPSSIDTLILTHLHFDHFSNNIDLFPSVERVLCHPDEIKYANKPDRFQKAGYLPVQYLLASNKIEFEPIAGPYQICEGIELIPTPGHTPGHQSVKIDFQGRTFVYTGDAAPIPENYEKRNIPGVLYSPVDALDSINRLHAISNATMIYSHWNEDQEL